ncbi:HupE/UreJ family protein [Winogradskya consettensis]|uniref:Membrane protein n=1 Tax=Winogradskya consettensis TaxID=113560 RepID=A0A919VTV3_9ACTN|nr:HupE/UreJ family protein [Actinoplanes consettensis]GIM76391.1 membrane protein [Actinoplanes consettensis]
MARNLWLAGAVLVAFFVLAPAPAQAHDVGATLLVVSATDTTVLIDAQIPLTGIDFAYDTALDRDPASAIAERGSWLRSLIGAGAVLTAPGGASWTVRVDGLTADRVQGRNTVHAALTATPPPGTGISLVQLRWGAVTDIDYSHKVYVSENDNGTIRLAGTITHYQPQLPLQRHTPLAHRVSFATMPATGFQHFRDGTDHQLFLCLVALGVARRKQRPAATVRRLGLLTLGFTIGHSVSLALATLGWVTLPSRWVETAIAATIAISAVHAARPALPARTELAVTACFGLVHGFGFAGTLEGLSLHGTALVAPLLGFNLGLEAAQLAALALVAIPLWLIARSAAATVVLAAAIAAIAISWVLQRALGTGNPIDGFVSTVLGTPERLALILLAGALFVLAVSATGRPKTSDELPAARPR